MSIPEPALTHVTYGVIGGASTPHAVPFPYIEKSHVIVEVNGVVQSTTSYTWPTDSSIQFLVEPTGTLEIRRTTPVGALTTYQSGSTLTSEDLEFDSLQALYLLEEEQDNRAAEDVNAIIAAAGYTDDREAATRADFGSADAAINAGLAALDADKVSHSTLPDEILGLGAGAAASSYTVPGGPGAVPRSVAARLSDVVSVKDFGAVGNGIVDDTEAIQACIDFVFLAGGTVYFPAGKYRTTAELYLDVRGVTGAPDSNQRRVNFRGAGKGNTVIKPNVDSIIALHIQGDNPLTSASHAYITLSDLAFGGNSPTPRTTTGLKLEDLAYLTVSDVTFNNMNVDMVLKGCLASTFQNVVFNESVVGVSADASASGPHSNLWLGCEFRALTLRGYDGYTSVSGATFINCRFEACGDVSNATSGAFRQNTSGSAGEHGATFIGCYFEGNSGGYDIQFNEIAATRVQLNVGGCCFNRVDATDFVTNNIVTTGDVDLNMSGNSFTSYNTYSPNAGRPYLNLSSTTRFRDSGNRYEDSIEGPTLSQSLPYAGFVSGSLGAAVTGVLPNGWSVSQVSTGLFLVTHNLGHTNYALSATTNTGNARVVERCVKQTNSFQVKVTTTANAASDDDFSFILSILKPNK